jgi:hypothetical protein
MNKEHAEELALALMNEHGLTDNGWVFGFHNSIKILGLCKHKEQRISLSTQYVEANDAEDIEQTMLHEIAHALLPGRRKNGTSYGHGPEWDRLAKSIGHTGGIRREAKKYMQAEPPIGLTTDLGLGDKVWLPFGANGLEGIVTYIGRTKLSFTAADGGKWNGYLEKAIKIAEREHSPVLIAA